MASTETTTTLLDSTKFQQSRTTKCHACTMVAISHDLMKNEKTLYDTRTEGYSSLRCGGRYYARLYSRTVRLPTKLDRDWVEIADRIVDVLPWIEVRKFEEVLGVGETATMGGGSVTEGGVDMGR